MIRPPWAPMKANSGVPTGVAVFGFDEVPIRRYGEASNTIVRWTEFDRGGHYAVLEVPDLWLGDVREFFAALFDWTASSTSRELVEGWAGDASVPASSWFDKLTMRSQHLHQERPNKNAARGRHSKARDVDLSGAGLRTRRRRGRDAALALGALASQLTGTPHGLGLLARLLLGGLLVIVAQLHFAKHTFALQLLLQGAKRLINIVIANDYLQAPTALSNRIIIIGMERRAQNIPRSPTGIADHRGRAQ